MSKKPSPSQLGSVTRRGFIAAGTAAAAATWTAASYGRIQGSNDRLRVGFIGVGGMGGNHINAIAGLKDANNLDPIAVADCWTKRAEAAAGKVGAKEYFQDYRKVIDRNDIDYVTIATPEHWHSRQTIEALESGKHVYCEKPMTHHIPEALAVVKAQKETGKALQVGVQGMSDDSYESAAEAIESGECGLVVQAQIEYVRRYGPAGPWRDPDAIQAELGDSRAKPADLDWNAWLGHAPQMDWDPHHYFEWRNYAAYSGGIATDLFIHRLTRIMKACKLTYPRRVVGMGGIWQWPDGRDLPDNFEMIVEYPRGMTVYVLGTQSNRVGIDHMIRGYRGTLYFTPTGWVIRDKDDKVLASHQKTGAEDISLHHTNLHNHIRNGEELHCPAELGLAGVVAVNMANESWRTGRMMGWDEEKMEMVPADQMGFDPVVPPAE